MGYTYKPVFDDHCEHGESAYIGSFDLVIRDSNNTFLEGFYDVYVYDGNRGSEICIRYGNEPADYISPGRIDQFAQLQQDEVKTCALALINKHGRFRYEKEEVG